MNDRLFSHSFDSTNEDPKPFGDKFISDKAMQDLMLNGFIKTNVDQNTSNDFLRYYYNYVVNHDSVIAYGKCMVNPGTLGGDDGIDTLCYYSVFDSGNLKYEIVIFDFFRRKTYVTEIAFKDGSFTSLLEILTMSEKVIQKENFLSRWEKFLMAFILWIGNAI